VRPEFIPSKTQINRFRLSICQKVSFSSLFWWWGIIDGQPFNVTEQVLTFFWAKKPRRFDLVAIYPIDK
jgi:hypothetical protein